MIKIGSVHQGYNQARNIINLPYVDVKIVKVFDIFKIYTHVIYKIFYTSHQLSKNFFFDFKINSVDVNHFFNGISLSNTPWITTFETSLPRLGEVSDFWYKLGVKRLAHKSCKKIIAMSHCAYEIQKQYLQKNYPEYYESIVEKMIVLHPQQKLLIDHYSQKNKNDDRIVFTLVGADFFRKGGREILNVFDKLIVSYPQIELNIVSSMQYGDYASKTTRKDLDKALCIIKKYPDNINHYTRLPNNKVLELFKKTDIGLLPTWGDTYGYSLLESQAAGCPVISTDIRALPEINNNTCGWLIHVPKDQNGNGILETIEDREIFGQCIEEQLYRIIKNEIIDHQDIIQKKGELALERIRIEHDPYAIATFLTSIYKEAVH